MNPTSHQQLILECQGLEQFEIEVIRASDVVLVDFYTKDCFPCQFLCPVLEELCRKYGAKLVKIDAQKNGDICEMFEVNGVPTVLFFKGGEVKDVVVGAGPKEVYDKKLEFLGSR